MSRAIELRATRKDTGETFEVLCIDFMHNSIFLDGHTIEIDIDSVIIEQFTGLLDCNGTKIFDGDIIQSYHFTDENGKDHFLSHIVKWSDKFNGWFMLNGKELSGNDGSIQMWVYMKSSKYTAKVIGNIHQNSELLK